MVACPHVCLSGKEVANHCVTPCIQGGFTHEDDEDEAYMLVHCHSTCNEWALSLEKGERVRIIRTKVLGYRVKSNPHSCN